MSDSRLERRLRIHLVDDASALPRLTSTAQTAMAHGRRRQRRRRLAGVVVGLIAAGTAGAIALPVLAPEAQEITAVATVGSAESVDSEMPSGETPAPRPVTEPELEPDTETGPLPAEPDDERQPPPTEADPGPGAESVLFASGAEGCESGSDRHPDWIEGQSSGGLDDQGRPTHGFAFHSGQAGHRFEIHERAVEGECVISLDIGGVDRQPASARLFRRYDRRGNELPEEAYYSWWIMIPQDVSFARRAEIGGDTVFGYWNVAQLYNDVAAADGGGESRSTLSVMAGRTQDEEHMTLSVYSKARCGAEPGCDDEERLVQPAASAIELPAGRWVHVQLYVRSAGDASGRVMLWQDGRLIIDHSGQSERDGATRRKWALTSSGVLHDPANHTVHIDDVVISTEPVVVAESADSD